MKSILIITQCWPPDASVGSLRPLHLARKLAERGWQPVILTVKEHYYQHVNGSEIASMPGTIIRTACLPHPNKVYLWLKKKVAKLAGQEQSLHETIKFEFRDQLVKSPSGLLGKLKRLLISFLITPDFWQGWIPPAVFAGLQAIKRHKIQVIISTGPPFSTHLVGWMLKKLSHVAWITDFRDPWSFNEQQLFATKASDYLNRRLEAVVVRNCDRVVTVTPSMTAGYRDLYVSYSADKWATISNGFDNREFTELRSIPRYSRLTISYLGHFSYTRTPDMILAVLGEMLNYNVISQSSLSVRFIGLCRYSNGRSVQDLIKSRGLENIVEIIDPIPRQEALLEMARSHLLLLLANDQLHQIPAKTYEYIGVGRPILAITEEKGATAQLINSIPGSAVVEPTDYAHLKRALTYWLDLHRGRENQSFHSQPDEDILKQYEWGSLAARYVDLIEECVRPLP